MIFLKVSKATDRGKVRESNEDACAFIPPDTYVVADGMGGYAAGEVASAMLVDVFAEMFSDAVHECGEKALLHAVQAANSKILCAAAASEARKGMGTTVVALQYRENAAYWAHVGDSRLYLLRKGVLRRLTRDHSFVQDLVERGSITEEEARNHPKKNLLTRAVGVEEKLVVDTGSFTPEAGDIFLLCSDGLTNMVGEAAIRETLQGESADKARTLVELALLAGGFDNITAIVVECDERG